MHHYLKLCIPIMHLHIFRKNSQTPDYIQTYSNGRRNPFNFACHLWYLYNSPQCDIV